MCFSCLRAFKRPCHTGKFKITWKIPADAIMKFDEIGLSPVLFKTNFFHKLVTHLVHFRGVIQARGSSTGLFCVGPTKVKVCKSFLFT